MAEIETRRRDIAALKGVHLFHFALSNCSQRVRFALAEKGASWTSHPVDLSKQEHLTLEFRALNPNGVVPVLVHDGRTIIESNDIIAYIDSNFDGPSLIPGSDSDQANTDQLIERASAIQPALKLLSHEFLFKLGRRMNAEGLAAFAAKGPSPELLQFMTDFCSPDGFGAERIKAAASEFTDAFAVLETQLDAHEWLSGPQFGLADISWSGNVHRMALMRWPIDRTPSLSRWYKRLKARAAFKTAILDFQPARVRAAFKAYSAARALKRDSVSNYL
jgi:glutathione S-transferase